MSVGLLAIVDDILSAALKASAKSAGVVIDDAAVTPQYVAGISPARELPVVLKIARGSLINKFCFIIPIALLLTAFAPWVLPYLLIIGGLYLCYEGAEKVTEWFGHHEKHADDGGKRDEKTLIAGAVRTDLILSTEIMLIGLSNLDPELHFWMRVGALVVIALAMTLLVYGAVALLVKLDDVGMKMETSQNQATRRFGSGIVRSMPAVFRVISIIGTVAMLWVGGHLFILNVGEAGWHFLADILHSVEHGLHSLGPVIVWLGDTAVSAVAGLILGLIVVGILMVVKKFLPQKEKAAH